MRSICLYVFAFFFLCGAAHASVSTLIGNTLTCEAYKEINNHKPGMENKDWRGIQTIYFTDVNMFMQAGTKEMKTGKIHSGGTGGLGQVFEWNKKYSGKVGLKDHFVSYASRGESQISYELEYTAYNRFADNVTIIALTRGQIHQENSSWKLFTEAKQRLSNGRQPAIYNTQTYFNCTLEQGRKLN